MVVEVVFGIALDIHAIKQRFPKTYGNVSFFTTAVRVLADKLDWMEHLLHRDPILAAKIFAAEGEEAEEWLFSNTDIKPCPSSETDELSSWIQKMLDPKCLWGHPSPGISPPPYGILPRYIPFDAYLYAVKTYEFNMTACSPEFHKDIPRDIDDLFRWAINDRTDYFMNVTIWNVSPNVTFIEFRSKDV